MAGSRLKPTGFRFLNFQFSEKSSDANRENNLFS